MVDSFYSLSLYSLQTIETIYYKKFLKNQVAAIFIKFNEYSGDLIFEKFLILMIHISMSHVTHMNESCHTSE